MTDWFLALHPVWQALIRALIVIAVLFCCLPVVIWLERRLLGWMQDRLGPNRVGTITLRHRYKWVPEALKGKKIKLFGLPQVLADGIKAFTKEDIIPDGIDKLLYVIAPAVFVFPAFALSATIPWGPFPALTPIADVNIGVLYILAVSSLGVYGVVLAGYSSNNKYSLLGGLRSSAQLISYELAMSMALAAIVMATGSLKLTDVVANQHDAIWGLFRGIENWNILTPYGFVAFIIFIICMVAETNRSPFDLPECENELVSGYNTEYSTKKWVLFMMGEYVNMLTYSAIAAVVFLGGWHAIPVNFKILAESYPSTGDIWRLFDVLNGNSILGPLWLLVKMGMFMGSYIWLRASMPRLRYDQLMNLGWKALLPTGVANLIVVGIWIVASEVYGPVGGWLAFAFAAALLYILYRQYSKATKASETLESRQVTLVDIPKPQPAEEAVA